MGMNEQDELVNQVGQVVDKAKGDGIRHVFGLDTIQGDKATTIAAAEQIIALVRADERKRIRAALTDPVMFQQSFIDDVTAALAAIGITVEDDQP